MFLVMFVVMVVVVLGLCCLGDGGDNGIDYPHQGKPELNLPLLTHSSVWDSVHTSPLLACHLKTFTRSTL